MPPVPDAGFVLQIACADKTLRGDVVSPDMEVHDDAVSTILFGMFGQRYAFGEKLLAYNVRRRTLYRLTGSTVARQYLQSVHPNSVGCMNDPLPPPPLTSLLRLIWNWPGATIRTTPAMEGGSGG